MTERAKTHMGTIKNWQKVDRGAYQFVIGEFSRFDGRFGHTSAIVRIICDRLETQNSWYTLVGLPQNRVEH